jgi:hypothetical protein
MMNFKIVIDYANVQAEVTGEDREELQQELLDLVTFINENEETFTAAGVPKQGDGSQADPESEQEISGSEETTLSDFDGAFGEIPGRTGIEESTLGDYFDIDPSGEEPPFLNFDPEILGESGSSRSEKQMRASLILFTLWREAMGVDEVKSPELKDALRVSGVDDTSLYAMYGFNNGEGDRYFSREGSGENTDISLRLPGKREGFDQIKRTVERLEPEDSD